MGRRKAPVPVTALRTQGKTQGTNKILSVQTLRQVERRYKVVELRRMGYSMQDIADTLRCSPETVSLDIESVLGVASEALRETTVEARHLELERYEALLRVHQPLAEAGNIASAGLVLSISDRIRKLLALDKPEEKKESETGMRIYVGINVGEV